MIGEYRFYQNGGLVASQKNLITTAGRRLIVDFHAGIVNRLVGSIGLGIGGTAPTLSDSSLEAQVWRGDIKAAMPKYSSNSVIYKATLSQGINAKIYEVGAFASGTMGGVANMTISRNQDLEPWSETTFNSTNSRLGTSLRITANASSTKTATLSQLYDLSTTLPNDKVTVALTNASASVTGISIRFLTDSSNYFSYNYSVPAVGVYSVLSLPRSAGVATGNPSWGDITSVQVLVTANSSGAGSVDLDMINITSAFMPAQDAMLSRTVLTTPVVLDGTPTDVEYTVTL